MPDPKTPIRTHLRVPCAGSIDKRPSCQTWFSVELPLDQVSLAALADRNDAVLTVNTASGQGEGVPLLISILCATCAERLLPRDLFEVAKASRASQS